MAYVQGQQQQTVVVQQQPQQPPVQTVIVQQKQPNPCRAAIPSMHIAMAITCLILNIFLPGIGTVVAGFAVFCCANKGQPSGERVGTFCINFWIGLVQLFLALWIVGWVWAIMWGAAMIALSNEYHNPPTTTTTVLQPNVGLSPQNVVITSQTTSPQQPYNPQGYVQQPPQPQGYQQPPPPQGYQQPPPQQGYPPQPLPQQGYPPQPLPQQGDPEKPPAY